jgi:hypothetical protein
MAGVQQRVMCATAVGDSTLNDRRPVHPPVSVYVAVKRSLARQAGQAEQHVRHASMTVARVMRAFLAGECVSHGSDTRRRTLFLSRTCYPRS